MLNIPGPERSARLGRLIRSIASACLDALFPRSAEELALEKLEPARAAEALPPAPDAPFPDMSAAFAYKDPMVRRLVWSLKYAKSPHAARIGGQALWRALDRQPRMLFLVPMPMTARRLRERGFDQTCALADAVREAAPAGRCAVIPGLLIRETHSPRQTLKGRAERLEGARGAFSVDLGGAIDPSDGSSIPFDASIIVVDDVVTTGSTMRSAVDALKKAGFANAAGLSLAR